MKLNYVTGDATNPQGNGKKVIAHCCNDIGAWGAGFVIALSRKWETPESSYRNWSKEGRSGGFSLGKMQLVQVEENTYVANIIGQSGIGPMHGNPPIRYNAIREGLRSLRDECGSNTSVHMPRMGCGLAGGSWDKIEKIVIEELVERGIEVTVYDLP